MKNIYRILLGIFTILVIILVFFGYSKLIWGVVLPLLFGVFLIYYFKLSLLIKLKYPTFYIDNIYLKNLGFRLISIIALFSKNILLLSDKISNQVYFLRFVIESIIISLLIALLSAIIQIINMW